MNEEIQEPSPETLKPSGDEGPKKVGAERVSAKEKVALTSELAHLRGEARKLAGADNSPYQQTFVYERYRPSTGETVITKVWLFMPTGREPEVGGDPFVRREQRIYFNSDGEITQIVSTESDEHGELQRVELVRDQGEFHKVPSGTEEDLTGIHADKMRTAKIMREAKEKHEAFLTSRKEEKKT